MTTITEAQFEALRKNLDADCQRHLKENGQWSLDASKLRVALESSGVGVRDRNPSADKGCFVLPASSSWPSTMLGRAGVAGRR